jgi:hypothetical protein
MAWTADDALEEAAYEAALEATYEAENDEYESDDEREAAEAERAFQEEWAYFHSAR